MEYNPLPTWDQYEIAEKNGISKSTVYQRINIQGWTVEKAITEPLFVSMKERYSEQWKIAEKNGILYRTFRSRITNLKWSPEEAATILTLSTTECANCVSEIKYVRNVVMNTLGECEEVIYHTAPVKLSESIKL
ncbi:hypothetical protein [Bacillus pseudomycoides]|uniref:hypothetical protein n=1 Tax=Bacillus pseudomycoides TaxID=64104 RepID=UPI0015CF662A|nr:hypothetical protein [Bacillus pseudomycoides]